MDVFTIQKARWREAWTRNIPMMDVTTGGVSNVFAPDWDLVMDFKNNRISEEQYIQRYQTLMNASWQRNKKRWIDTMNLDHPIAFSCFCRSSHYRENFCHRYLLVDIFEKLCKKYQVPFYYYGELS